MESDNNTVELHRRFVAKLAKRYGVFNNLRNKFESTSNSIIARDLFYSDSQFSRLINNTASEGEFKRALGNIDRLLELDQFRKHKVTPAKNTKNGILINRKYLLIALGVLVSLIIISLLIFKKYNPTTRQQVLTDDSRYAMLKWAFENNFIQPYVKLKELPQDCYYPCYKYQGKWSLKNKYKIPFYREKNGFHYVATEATMYARCVDEKGDSGESFEGYEYQKHEIWYDKREHPIDSFLTKGSNTQLRKSYILSDLNEDDNFVKIAYVHTFFRTEFQIDSSLIRRTGKALGRDIEFVNDEVLKNQLNEDASLIRIKDEIKAITINRLVDYSKPINCEPTLAPDINFNLIEEGDEMSFNCHFSIGYFIVNYTKTYIFEDQYINNYCR